MPLKHKDRPSAGFKAEESEARREVSNGKKVVRLKKNHKNSDLKVNGKGVEVKAAIKTRYKGSDGYPIEGYVFSNMKRNPSADKYVLKCMSPDRSRVVARYEIPAKKVKQMTLTITDNGKYSQYKVAHPQPARFGDDPFVPSNALQPRQKSLEQQMHEMAGMAAGSLIGGALTHAALVFQRKSAVFDVDFRQATGAAVGGIVGRRIGKTIGERHDENRVY